MAAAGKTSTAGFTATIVHADRRGSIEHGSIHKPVHTAVTFAYDDARDLGGGDSGGESRAL